MIVYIHVYIIMYMNVYIPGIQMGFILSGKGLVLEGSRPKIEDKQVPGIHIYQSCHASLYHTLKIKFNVGGI